MMMTVMKIFQIHRRKNLIIFVSKSMQCAECRVQNQMKTWTRNCFDNENRQLLFAFLFDGCAMCICVFPQTSKKISHLCTWNEHVFPQNIHYSHRKYSHWSLKSPTFMCMHILGLFLFEHGHTKQSKEIAEPKFIIWLQGIIHKYIYILNFVHEFLGISECLLYVCLCHFNP